VDRGRVKDAASANEENAIVFQALRQWRLETAKEHGVPAYTVFHDSTLRELSGTLPQSLDELRSVSGIGAKKIERYGPELLGVIQRAGK
jgi:ATP-dependent DNA helicase RecQ